MKNVAVLGLLSVCLLLVGCQTASQTSSSASPYMGTWTIVVAGDIVGSTSSTIDANGDFSFSVFVTSAAGSYTSIISGTIDASGNVSGYSYYGGSKSATISGKMIGSAGSGTYTAISGYVGTGTWTMTKH